MDSESYQNNLFSAEKSVLLSGASGMLGTSVAAALRQQGSSVCRLVRRAASSPGELRWNPENPASSIDPEELEARQPSAAIHLSGANVAAHRWTEAYKQEMRDSRVGTSKALCQALAKLKKPPQVLVMASAVGFYGDRGASVLDEASAPGQGFFPELCQAWEAASRPAAEAGIRVVHLRFGMVIGRNAGAMARLAPMFRLGLGGCLGNGRQWMSWISESDAVRTILFALEHNTLTGPVNAVAPEPVTNAAFTSELGHAVHRPAILPAPAFALRLAFGEMANEALLASTRAIPKRLLQAGFVFKHPTIAEAFAAALAS